MGQLEHPHEHRRDELPEGHPVLVDEPQRILGVEVLHDHDRSAGPLHGQAEPERSGVVERRR
jgi:hypothetical protein